MKIQIISDTHLEFYERVNDFNFKAKDFVGDILVLAGDISSRPELTAEWLHSINKTGKPVIFVPGNHEYYHHNIEDERARITSFVGEPWFHLMNNDSLDIGNVRFLGTTLWTNFASGLHKYACSLGMADFSVIRNGVNLFSVDDAFDEFKAALAWLDVELSHSQQPYNVVITHHGPSFQSTHPRFAGSKINGGFCSDLDDFIEKHTEKLQLWIHGHVHDGVDYHIGKTRVVANPVGYPDTWYNKGAPLTVLENESYNPHFCIDVGSV